MRSILATFVLTVLAAWSVALAGVEVRHDPETDFTAYRTYEWVEGDPPRSPDIRNHLERRIDEQLSAAGLRKVAGGGDLKVAVHVVAATEGYATGLYLNAVTWDVGILVSDVRAFSHGTLIVDLVDAAENRGVWQGRASATMVDNDYRALRKKVDKATKKMFRSFPP